MLNRSDNCQKTADTDWRRAKVRQRTIRKALDYFDGEMPKIFKGRSWALDRIRRAKIPGYEAKRLVTVLRNKGVIAGVSDDGEPDYSDVQELRVRIIRAAGIVDAPQSSLLGKMDRMVARGEMDRAAFNRTAALVVRMPQALPVELRRLEAAFRPGWGVLGPTYLTPPLSVLKARDSAAFQTTLDRPTSNGEAVTSDAPAFELRGVVVEGPEAETSEAVA